MDGQLGRERAASYPAPIPFPSPTKLVSSQHSHRGGTAFWVQGSKDTDSRQLKVNQVSCVCCAVSILIKQSCSSVVYFCNEIWDF
jgi:hypothetical protein